MITPEQIRAKLDEILDPCSCAAGRPTGIVSLGLIKEVSIDHGDVKILLRTTGPQCTMVGRFHYEIDRLLGGLDGVHSVAVEIDGAFDWSPELFDIRLQKTASVENHSRQTE